MWEWTVKNLMEIVKKKAVFDVSCWKKWLFGVFAVKKNGENAVLLLKIALL